MWMDAKSTSIIGSDILRAIQVFFVIVAVALSLTVIFAGIWAQHSLPDSPRGFLRSLIAIGMLVAVPLAAIAAQYDLRVSRYHKSLDKLASTDGLTGLLSRRRFSELADAMLGRVRDGEMSAALMLLDLDHFKSINDRYGHNGGDDLLRLVAQRVRSELRDPRDQAGRWGGEEFAILVSNVTLEQALGVAERLRRQVETAKFYRDDEAISTTASIGVTLLSRRDTLEDATERADVALYEAKSSNRNCVCLRLVAPRIEPVTNTDQPSRDAALETSSRAPSEISGLSRA